MNKLLAGFARVDITPMMGIHVDGYFQERYADGVLDPLGIHVLALSCEAETALLISMDVCEMEVADSDDLRRQVCCATDLPMESVLIFATHTHTGSNPACNSTDPLRKEYYQMVSHRLVDACRFALEDLKPAKMGWGVGLAPNVAFVRRFRMKDGSVQTNPGVDNPDIVAPVGQVDEQVSVVRFDRENADTLVLVNFANHPDVVGGCKISSDWPGFLRSTVEKVLDNTKCIFLNGAEGDVNHVNVHPTGGYLNDTFMDFDDVSRGYDHARYMGRVVAGGVLQAFDKVLYRDVDSLKCMKRTIQLPSNMPTAEEAAVAHVIHDMHMAGRDSELPYAGMMLTTVVAEAGRMVALEHGPESYEMTLSGVAVGDVALVGIPGEPFNAIGRDLKKDEHYALVLPCCLTNGTQGYFPTKDAYDEGGYEARSSVFKGGVAEIIMEEGHNLLNEMKKG